MQEIMLCRLENWMEESKKGNMPCVIVGTPCVRLQKLQEAGYCVLAELSHLQGLDEEAVAEALCREEAVQQFENVCIDAAELPQAYLRRIWCKAQGRPVLIAETERLVIRESITEDAAAFMELYQDEECRKYLEMLPVDEKCRKYLEMPPVDEKCRKYLEMPPVNEEGRKEQEMSQGDEESREYPEILPVDQTCREGVKAYQRYLEDYQKGQYAFFEYGMWTLVEKTSGAVIGRAGLEQQENAGGPGADWSSREKQESNIDSGIGKKANGDATGAVLSLGYALLPQFRGKGYAVEACRAILEYCKECEYADKVYVTVDEENMASRKVFGKLLEHSCVELELILK